MSNLINPSDNSPHKFERFVALNNGEFWQAKKRVKDRNVDEGEILMISQIDYVDDAPHTIHVRLHPSKTSYSVENVKFLVEEFVNTFEFVEREVAELSRQNEINKIQQKMQDEQNEMQQAFTDSRLLDELVEKEMPKETGSSEAKLPVKLETFDADIVGAVKTQNLTALMSKGLTAQGVEQIKSGLEDQKEIALRRSKWIEMRTKRLARFTSEMTPYFQEKAALPLAMSKDMMDHVDDLMKGIGNLNLYVLKDVDIEQVKEGKSAPESERLAVTQRVLYMDEEMAVWADVGDDFDFKDINKFCKTVSESQDLVNQIFPTERCIVSIAATRKYHEYEGYSPQERAQKDANNKRQFLLVRDGDNIYLVLSPELFHNFAKSTFPTTDETEGVFKGFDGRNVTYRDLDYTARLEQHERIALGYKRLLILLCGLDHNKQLFGKFYDGEPSLDFVSLSFQERYFNFIHDLDGEGALPSYRPKSFKAWAEELNSEISYGSRVLLQWREVLDEDNCPSAFERESRWNMSREGHRYMQYTPTGGSVLVGVVEKRGNDMVMKIEVSGERRTDYETRTFDAVFNLSLAQQYSYGLAKGILCLDRLNPKDANWYLHDRASRILNVSGIRMLKRAIKYSEEIRGEESEVREAIMSSALSSGLFDDKEYLERVIDKALGKWRCANPKKEARILLSKKKDFNSLCDQVFFLSGKGKDPKDDIISAEDGAGRSVLRISLQANGKYVAYSTPLANERDDRVEPFTWVAKTTYSLLSKGVKGGKPSFVLLSKVNNAETIVFESEDVNDYASQVERGFATPNKKAAFFEKVDASYAQLQEMIRIKEENDIDAMTKFIEDYDHVRDRITYSGKRSGGVKEPEICLSIGATVVDNEALVIGYSSAAWRAVAWMVSDNDDMVNELLDTYTSIFVNSRAAEERFNKFIEHAKGKVFFDALELQLEPDFGLGMYECKTSSSFIHISKKEGYEYSIAKRIEKYKKDGVGLYLCGGVSLDELDEVLGTTRPDDFNPVIAVRQGDFEKEKIHLFDFSDENFKLLKNLRTQVFANEDSFYDERKSKYHSKGRYNEETGETARTKVTMELVEVEPEIVKGLLADKTFVYKTVREESDE